MSVEVNSKIGAQSDSTGADTRGLEPISGVESEGPMAQASLGVESVFGSSAIEYAASVVGSSTPSADGAICSGSRARTVTGAVYQA